MQKKFPLLLTTLSVMTLPLCAAKDDGPIGITGEFVYIRRALSQDRVLVNDPTKPQDPTATTPDYSILTTKRLVQHFDFEPGIRLGVTYNLDRRSSLEIVYMHVNEWSHKLQVHDTGELNFPFKSTTFAGDFTNADTAVGKLSSHFMSSELNYWNNLSPRDEDYFALAAIMGVRYIRIFERFNLAFTKGQNTSNYRTRTDNDVPVVQFGVDLQFNPSARWNWEIAAKAGPTFVRGHEHTFLGDSNNTITLRKWTRHQWKWGVLAEASASLGYTFLSCINLHAGYDFIYLANVALAPEQIRNSVIKVHPDTYVKGQAMYHGIFAGLTINL